MSEVMEVMEEVPSWALERRSKIMVYKALFLMER